MGHPPTEETVRAYLATPPGVKSGRQCSDFLRPHWMGKTVSQTTVFLLDVDNTLLDNDAIEIDISARLEREFGRQRRDRYWAIFETLRAEEGYADYLGALQKYRLEDMDDARLLQMASFILDYPFTERLYPGALRVVEHFSQWGAVVILSDGDAVFQPRKIERSGLWQAVDGRVLIYVHKESMLADVRQRYPADRYVVVDDKLPILAAMKEALGGCLTTVFVRQGHYARDPALTEQPAADATVQAVDELLQYDLAELLGGGARRGRLSGCAS